MTKPATTLMTAAIAGSTLLAQSGSTPPAAARVPHTTSIHGYTLSDDYFWLRQKSNPEVTKYLEAENAYTESVMGPTKPLQETLYKEMLGRIKQTDTSVPYEKDGWWYFNTTKEGEQYPRFFRSKTKDLKDPQHDDSTGVRH